MANFNFNKVVLGGRLTDDPKQGVTPGGVSVVDFTIAVTRKMKAKDGSTTTDFLPVVAWNKLAEFIGTYFRRGSSICLTGAVQTRSWIDKDGQKRYSTEIVADEVFFVDSKAEAEASRTAAAETVPRAEPGMFATPGARSEISGAGEGEPGELPF